MIREHVKHPVCTNVKRVIYTHMAPCDNRPIFMAIIRVFVRVSVWGIFWVSGSACNLTAIEIHFEKQKKD